jgi:hypothetical protein
MMPLGPHGNQS